MDLEITAEDSPFFCENGDENGLLNGSSSDEAESTSEPRSGNDRPNMLSEFASEFYSGGSDYSSLIGNKKKNGLFVQKNLLQMWGIEKSGAADSSESRVSMENRKRKKSENEKEQWAVFGLNQKEFEKGKKPAIVQSRSCPFYKKIPGKFLI